MDAEPLVQLVGGDKTETLVAHEMLGRLMIQCARQPGLSTVYEHLLGFDGAEFYFKVSLQSSDRSAGKPFLPSFLPGSGAAAQVAARSARRGGLG